MKENERKEKKKWGECVSTLMNGLRNSMGRKGPRGKSRKMVVKLDKQHPH